MTAKELLTTCREAVLALRTLDDQLSRCLPDGRPSGVKAQRWDASLPGTNDPTAAAIQLKDGLMAQRDELALQVSRLSKAAWNLLRSMKDVRALVILNSYYLLGMSDLEIARQQDLTREYICALRRKAIGTL